MALTLYPTLEEALYLHDRLIDLFGGAKGVIDLGLLESALARPRSGYYPTLLSQGAALFHSLINNHSFVDGDKRVAFALMAIFLEMNGWRLTVLADEAEKFIIDEVIAARADVKVIALWLEARVEKIK